MKFSEVLNEENGQFLIYLMESFINIFQYDNGIEFFLRSGFMKRLNYMLTNKEIVEFNFQFSHRVHHLFISNSFCTVFLNIFLFIERWGFWQNAL